MHQVVRHTRFERFTLHAAGLILFMALSMVLPSMISGLDARGAGLMAMLLSLLAWYLADVWMTRRRGLTVLSMRLDVADYSDEEPVMTVWEIKQAIIAELSKISETLSQAEEIHFIGFEPDDSGIFMRMIDQALHHTSSPQANPA